MAEPKITRQLVICIIKNPKPLPIIFFADAKSMLLMLGFNCGCCFNRGIEAKIKTKAGMLVMAITI